MLNAKPGLLFGGGLKNTASEVTEVGVSRLEFFVGLVSILEGLGHDDDVVATSEGVGVISNGLHDDFRIMG